MSNQTASARSVARQAEDPRAVAKAAGLAGGTALETMPAADAFIAATQEFAHPATLVQPVAEVLEKRFGPGALAASQGLMELNGKILDMWRSQTESTLALWKSMMGVTSLSEAVQLQTSHLRLHYEEMSQRAKDIAQTAVRMANGITPDPTPAVDPPDSKELPKF